MYPYDVEQFFIQNYEIGIMIITMFWVWLWPWQYCCVWQRMDKFV